MTDRELLEAAAKAAGIDYEHPFGTRSHPDFNEFVTWNPLTDDGDALRLAVKLGMSVHTGGNVAHVYYGALLNEQIIEHGEILEATRRAIVRAAAKIGKAMQAG